MNAIIATQVADLLNSQNELSDPYTTARVLKNAGRYIVRLNEKESVQGCVEVKKFGWYQCEIAHLSVSPSAKRRGLGTALLLEAESRAKQLGARIVQCTIRVGNVGSEGCFQKNGYVATVTFTNKETGNRVTVYQKVLSEG
jgi:ribosomal protein S18 acetylase RimI-like enzyme